MSDENQNPLDKKLKEINKLFDQIEQARIDGNVGLQLDLMEEQRQNIQDVKKHIEVLRNYADAQVIEVLEQMRNYIAMGSCDSIVSYVQKYNWLYQFKIYKDWWYNCQK